MNLLSGKPGKEKEDHISQKKKEKGSV